jgi:CubicO group peptidase (beta-lactamase class C family)
MRERISKGLLATLAMVAASAVQAQAWHEMNNPERIQSGLQANAAQIHRLKPARKIRELKTAAPSEAGTALASDADSFARGTFATLVVENGEVVYETYGQGATADTLMNGYSVTKSWTALAVGEALCAGKIKSLDDPAKAYAPQLAGTAYGEASVRNLLRYTSGAEDPGGNGYTGIHSLRDFSSMTQHKLSLLDLLKKNGDTSRFKPGEKFIYNGLDSEALSLVVRGATGMPLPAWFESTVWQEAGGESPGAWYVDKDGNGIAEVLLFVTSRDYARVALYVMDRMADRAGNECIRQFVKEAAQPLVAKGYWNSVPTWGLGLHQSADGNVWMFGYGGQRIGINTQKNRVFVTNSNRDLQGTDSGAIRLLAR